MTVRLGITIAAMLVAGLLPVAAAAQQRLVVIGAVQWTTTNRIQMMTDAGISVSIDVSRLDQGSYTSLRSGERLRVIGVVSPDRSRLIADTIEPADPGGGYWSVFPEAG